VITLLDLGLGICVLGSALLGTKRGFIHEAAGFFPWIGACFLPFQYTQKASYFFKDIFPPSLAPGVSGIILFVLAFFGLKLFVRLLAWLFTLMPLDFLMRPLGFLIGLARGLFLVAIILAGLEYSFWQKERWFTQSFVHKVYGVELKQFVKKYLFKQWINTRILMI
jgi:uncharacterized membrane protein required for colicin V production